jgi:hypothetical protein
MAGADAADEGAFWSGLGIAVMSLGLMEFDGQGVLLLLAALMVS